MIGKKVIEIKELYFKKFRTFDTFYGKSELKWFQNFNRVKIYQPINDK